MDEEQEILQSSLQQSDKISIGSFFGSPIGGLANRAISQSNTSLKSSITNRNLIATLQASIELLRGQLQQITNYVLIDRQERSRIIKQRETEAFEREDAIQKGIIRPENAQPIGLEDAQPFFPENRFSQGLTAGMSSIGDPKGVTKFQQDVLGIEAEGSKSFRFGGLVPGSGNADTVNAKLTPGEFVVPKKTVENFSSNFFNDLTDSKPETNTYSSSIQYSTRGNPKTGEIEVDPNSLEYPFMLEAATQQFYQDKVEELESEIFDAKLEAKVGGYKPDISNLEEELNKYKGKYDDTLEYGTRYNVGGNKDNKEDDKEGGFFKNLFGKKKNENIKSDDKENKGLFGGLFGGNKKNENVRNNDKNVKFNTYEDYDDDFSDPFFDDGVGFDELINDDSVKSGDKRGLFGVIGGTIDAATGNLTDFDKRGGKPFGLMRGITGSIDAMTGGLTDLDRRGGKPFGLMRGITGIADAMTGNKFDFDRRGDGKSKNKFYDKDGNYIGDNERTLAFEKKKNELLEKRNKIPMETTVNPDGSITSKGSGTLIGGELFTPGQPLTENQKMRIQFGLSMGNTYSEEIMKSYNMEPIKSEDIRPEEEKSKNLKSEDIRPEEEKSKNLKPEQTLGERFMNIFRGKDEELTKGFSTYPSKSETPSIEPASQNNLKVAPSESIKTVAQGLMTPPPPPQSETIELPPQTQGDAGGGGGIQGGVPQFKPSTPNHDPLTGTESPLIFVEVISNPFLSIP